MIRQTGESSGLQVAVRGAGGREEDGVSSSSLSKGKVCDLDEECLTFPQSNFPVVSTRGQDCSSNVPLHSSDRSSEKIASKEKSRRTRKRSATCSFFTSAPFSWQYEEVPRLTHDRSSQQPPLLPTVRRIQLPLPS